MDNPSPTDVVADAQRRAADIVAAAEAEAAQLLEQGEARLRRRADEVLREVQGRLDDLLAEERAVRARVDELRGEVEPEPEIELDVVDARDQVSGIEVVPDDSLADFLKTTLREIDPS